MLASGVITDSSENSEMHISNLHHGTTMPACSGISNLTAWVRGQPIVWCRDDDEEENKSKERNNAAAALTFYREICDYRTPNSVLCYNRTPNVYFAKTTVETFALWCRHGAEEPTDLLLAYRPGGLDAAGAEELDGADPVGRGRGMTGFSGGWTGDAGSLGDGSMAAAAFLLRDVCLVDKSD
jgi:hypothetical protein